MAEPDLDVIAPPHPREQQHLVGHADAERALLEAYQSGQLHHAWLIGGREGIGKATLAYRFARFLLAQQGAQVPTSFAIDPASPAARQVAARSHPNLLVLDLALLGTEKEPARSISVEAVRRVISFFGSTSGDGGYRVAIVDCAEDLTNSSANALLKAVEEPPQRSIFLIVSHAPQRIMATIRSRCRKLTLRPLGEADLREALRYAGVDTGKIEAPRLARAIELAEGSVGHALELLDPDKIALIAQVTALLDALPRLDTKRVLGLADKLVSRQKDEAYALTLETVRRWLSARVGLGEGLGPARLMHLVRANERLNDAALLTDTYNLDRRAFLVELFGDLAEAVGAAG